MDASRYNSPSRKSRFRAQGPSTHRPASPVDESATEAGEYPATDVPEEVLPDEPYAEAPPEEGGYTDEVPPVGVQPYEENYAGEPSAETRPDTTLPAAAFPPEDSLPAGLRLTRMTERSSDHDSRWLVWPTVVISLLCLVAGAVGGYLLRGQKPLANPTAPGGTAPTVATNPILPLNPAVLKEIDDSFEATKEGKFPDARQHFGALGDQHPGWPSMRIEAARAALYEHDFDGAEKILSSMLRTGPNTDAEFLMGLLQMTMQAYDKSEAAFGRAVALDPGRPDIFYFWGECLRREGRPQDAAAKFHEALIRNQYETTEGLYQLKLWLSEIQADQESAKGSNAKIDVDLASGHPSGPALFAAAARNVKAGQYKEAGERIGQAQKVMEPAVFRVILQDPVFLDQRDRPELVPFFKF